MASAGVLIGLPERPIENVTLDNVIIDADVINSPIHAAMAFNLEPMLGQGIWGQHVKGLALRNCQVTAARGPALTLIDSHDIELSSVTALSREDGVAGIDLRNTCLLDKTDPRC